MNSGPKIKARKRIDDAYASSHICAPDIGVLGEQFYTDPVISADDFAERACSPARLYDAAARVMKAARIYVNAIALFAHSREQLGLNPRSAVGPIDGYQGERFDARTDCSR